MSNWFKKAIENKPSHPKADVLAQLPISPWNGTLYHGSPIEGMIAIASEGFYPNEHSELNAPFFSTSINSRALNLFSEGTGRSGFEFDVNFSKVLELDMFHYAIASSQTGAEWLSEMIEKNPEVEDRAEKLGYRGRFGDIEMQEGELANLIPSDVEGVIVPGFESSHRNAESEIAVTEFGCNKLMGFISKIWIKDDTYDPKDGLEILRQAGELIRQGKNIDEAIEQATEDVLWETPSTASSNGWLKLAITDAAKQERSLWYHGTQGKNLSSILSQGLIPDPKERAFDLDNSKPSLASPSLASLGGVYLTRNLMTARSSASRLVKRGEPAIIVIVEAQPRSFVADEDDVTYIIKNALGDNNWDSEWMIAEAYIARELGTNEQFVNHQRQNYVQRGIEVVKQRFLPDAHQALEKRLAELLTKGWDIALDRQAAHTYVNSPYDWRRVFYRNISQERTKELREMINELESKGLSYDDAYVKIMDQVVPPRPDAGLAENKFAAYSNEITKTLKHIARPAKSKKSYNEVARSLNPIGFSGSNKIVGIVEYVYNHEKYGDYHERVKLVYGIMPEDFISQWKQSVGDMIMLDDSKAASSAKNFTKLAVNQATQEQISSIAKQLIKGAWSQPYFTDRDFRYSDEQVILIARNEQNLSDLLFSLGEENVDKIEDEIKKELIRLEEKKFNRRNKKLSGEFDHVRLAIKGKTWGQAKMAIIKMMPGGWLTDSMPSDEQAEKSFTRLYGSIHAPGFSDIEMLKQRSPYILPNGDRYFKRLSEVENDKNESRTDENGPRTDGEATKYQEIQMFWRNFGYDSDSPPTKIEVYRGVPRMDAKLRPGDYVTTNRSYARSYMTGKTGAILREVVNSDDLLVMKIDDPDIPEFVYYPRSAMSSDNKSSRDIKPTYTFRQFWSEVNGGSA